MRRKPRVLLDVDGVIADFAQYYKDAAVLATGREELRDKVIDSWRISEALGLTDGERESVHDYLFRPHSARSGPQLVGPDGPRVNYMRTFPGAVAGVKQIMSVAAVYFVTTPLIGAPTWCSDRYHWIGHHFGEEAARRLIFAEHKHVVAGDIFVDDKPANVLQWLDAWDPHVECVAVLWRQPYNYKAPQEHQRFLDYMDEHALDHHNDWDMLYQLVSGWGGAWDGDAS